jgi:hypothetical protein
MEPIKFHTEHFEGEAKKVGDGVIGNDTIPVFEFSVKPSDEDLDDFNMSNKEFSKYEQEFLDLAQKLRSEIEKETPVSLSFITSEINRYLFSKVDWWSDDNPVEGFMQAWTYGDEEGWLSWLQSPAVAEKCEKDETFRTALEKWALARFLQLVFGEQIMPSPVPRYGSESHGFGNGSFGVGKMGACHFWSKYSCETDLPEHFIYYGNIRLTAEEVERLYEVLIGRLSDFFLG